MKKEGEREGGGEGGGERGRGRRRGRERERRRKGRERGRGEGGGEREGEEKEEEREGERKKVVCKNSKAKEQDIRVILFPFYSHGLLYIELCHRVIVNGQSGERERHGKRRGRWRE